MFIFLILKNKTINYIIYHNVYARYDTDIYKDFIHIGRFIEHKPIFIDDINSYNKDYKKLNHRV